MKNIIFKAPSKNIKKDENLLNLIPCIIHHTGKANVNEYFNHKVQTLKDGGEEDSKVILKNSLYGRKLKGREVQVDQGFVGVVFQKEHVKQMDFEFIPIEYFTKFRYWNHDDNPKANDKFNEIISYMNIMTEVNKEVSF